MNDAPGEHGTTPSSLLRDRRGDQADVRVLRVREMLLFIPTSWFTRIAYAESFRPGERSADALEPLLRRDEVPGLIHGLRRGGRVQLYLNRSQADSSLPQDFPVTRIELSEAPNPDTSIAMEVEYSPPDELGWAQWGKGDYFADAISLRKGGGAHLVSSASLVTSRAGNPTTKFPNHSGLSFQGQVSAVYYWREEECSQPHWRQLRKRMTDLLAWLATPPAQRDLNHSF
jgi:hypothetical protein